MILNQLCLLSFRSACKTAQLASDLLCSMVKST